MNDIERKIERARDRIHLPWPDDAGPRLLRSVRQRHRRRRALRAAGATACAVLLIGLLHHAHRPSPPVPGPNVALPTVPPASPPQAVVATPLPRHEAPPAGPSAPRPDAQPHPGKARHARAPRVASASAETPGNWQELAQEGRYDQAYTVLQQSPAARAGDEMEELLLRADVARLSHHPSEAVPSLTRALKLHAGDPRAPLAAFTLGMVLADLGNRAESAGSFRRAQELDPAGQMAQDALAREVEAWARAGDRDQARQRAGEYVRRYPDGRRLRTVRRLGALD